jgi:hypothetical protein
VLQRCKICQLRTHCHACDVVVRICFSMSGKFAWWHRFLSTCLCMCMRQAKLDKLLAGLLSFSIVFSC